MSDARIVVRSPATWPNPLVGLLFAAPIPAVSPQRSTALSNVTVEIGNVQGRGWSARGFSVVVELPGAELNAATADEAARIRRRTKLKLPDAIQAAFALRNRLKLATRNVKDFAPSRFDFVTVPYRL